MLTKSLPLPGQADAPFSRRYIATTPVAHGVILLRARRRGLLDRHAIWRQAAGGRAAQARPRRQVPGRPSCCIAAFVAGDNLLWRVAGWIASSRLCEVTGDLRSELFRHLTGHAPPISPNACRAR